MVIFHCKIMILSYSFAQNMDCEYSFGNNHLSEDEKLLCDETLVRERPHIFLNFGPSVKWSCKTVMLNLIKLIATK